MGQNHPKGQGTSSAARNPPTVQGATRLPQNSTNSKLIEKSPTPKPTPAPTTVVPTIEEPKVPVVIRYRVGATKTTKALPVNTVEVLLENEGWKRYPLTPSADDFFTVVQLPTGVHGYKFIVNGAEVIDNRQPVRPPTATLPSANVVTVSEAMLRTRDDAEAADDDTDGWGQVPVVFEETRKLPPVLPPHMRYTPLNTPPTQYRCDEDGHVSAVANDYALDPEHLPLPLSATINHVYFQRRDDHVVVGVTTRFRNKFTSVVLYRGNQSLSVGAAP